MDRKQFAIMRRTRLLTGADGNEILDDFGEPIRLGFGNMQIEPLDTTLSHTEFVIRSLQW